MVTTATPWRLAAKISQSIQDECFEMQRTLRQIVPDVQQGDNTFGLQVMCGFYAMSTPCTGNRDFRVCFRCTALYACHDVDYGSDSVSELTNASSASRDGVHSSADKPFN